MWRELRRVGALSLQQATWAVPAREEFAEAIDRATALVVRAGGEALVFDAAPHGEQMDARLQELFTADREAEWAEFIDDCGKFEREIEKEIKIERFTVAELDEEEQSLERLRRWFRELRGRDVFRAASQRQAELRLKRCGERLDDFAERVYEYGGNK